MTIIEISILAASIIAASIIIGVSFFFQARVQSSLMRNLFRYEERLRRGEREREDGFSFWEFRYGSAERQILDIIRTSERARQVELTWAARALLTIPIIEEIEMRGDVEWPVVNDSIRTLIDVIVEDRRSAVPGREGSRNAKSVIRAFYQRFCRIPPFCDRRE